MTCEVCELEAVKVKCPECGARFFQVYTGDFGKWKPENCPRCKCNVSGSADGDLQPEGPYYLSVKIDPLSGKLYENRI
ncbi:hypothetical protein [Desulfofundulus thermobenzoicus]|uniref:hypothetical protein n=1 Tax=Desulfofundulus thermobenzoicus TaxID=29376 RepID=UPI00128F32E2|nr:hypothetical protein [Desulfofundulus thermobenzoicus]